MWAQLSKSGVSRSHCQKSVWNQKYCRHLKNYHLSYLPCFYGLAYFVTSPSALSPHRVILSLVCMRWLHQHAHSTWTSFIGFPYNFLITCLSLSSAYKFLNSVCPFTDISSAFSKISGWVLKLYFGLCVDKPILFNLIPIPEIVLNLCLWTTLHLPFLIPQLWHSYASSKC